MEEVKSVDRKRSWKCLLRAKVICILLVILNLGVATPWDHISDISIMMKQQQNNFMTEGHHSMSVTALRRLSGYIIGYICKICSA